MNKYILIDWGKIKLLLRIEDDNLNIEGSPKLELIYPNIQMNVYRGEEKGYEDMTDTIYAAKPIPPEKCMEFEDDEDAELWFRLNY